MISHKDALLSEGHYQRAPEDNMPERVYGKKKTASFALLGLLGAACLYGAQGSSSQDN